MFIDTKEKDIKYAFASMFVEILMPVAASANRELNVPALKNFVDMMFHHALDLAKNRKHSQVLQIEYVFLLDYLYHGHFLNASKLGKDSNKKMNGILRG